MSINLDAHVTNGKIVSYSYGMTWRLIHDLNGKVSNRLSVNYYCTMIRIVDGKRESEEFDGVTWESVKEQIENFILK